METKMVPGTSKTGGLLVAAYRAGQTEAINWVELQVGDLILTVAADAMKAPLNDRTGVRLPISYAEQVALCREMNCVSATQAMADAMFKNAKAQLNFVPLVMTAADSMKMATVDFTLRFHDGVEKQLADKDQSGLIFGAWKLWIMHQRLGERGAVNYGFWDKSKNPARPIQTVGGQHDAAHYDYSQLFQPIQRLARKASTGEIVDLLDYIGPNDHVADKFITAYKEVPNAGGLTNFNEEREVNIVDVLKAVGVNVAPVDGWETRGKPGFEPNGILVHHTAGPKKGDAPSLGLCVKGRIDTANPKNNLPGPLCHIVLARSGTAHVVAANIANHAGQGSKEVLEAVRRDNPVTGNARTNNYQDAVSGNTYLYGIEVENSGAADDPYPEAQINALANICAALCYAHGWTANRVVHHRQWTGRKVDMSYKGDLNAMVAQMMDAGAVHTPTSFLEDDDDLGPETDPCLPWEGYDFSEPADASPTNFSEPADASPATPATSEPAAKPEAPEAATPGKPNTTSKGAAKKTAKPAAKKAAKPAAKKTAKKTANKKPAPKKKTSHKAKGGPPKAAKKKPAPKPAKKTAKKKPTRAKR